MQANVQNQKKLLYKMRGPRISGGPV